LKIKYHIFRNQKILKEESEMNGKVTTAEIKARGQLTIPKRIRDEGNLEEGQVVTIIPVGDALVITPKRMALEEARRAIRKILRDSGISEKELLSGLKEGREALYREKYDKKRA
jgi:AbrB family looped-hinge helix DNA binding protein